MSPAYAGCKKKADAAPAHRLENVIVTPNGAYTETEWAQHQAEKRALASAVTLPPMVVTPDYTITAQERAEYMAQKRQLAHANAHVAASAPQVSAGPGAPRQPNLINFMRKLLTW
jgi:hypothetical protein